VAERVGGASTQCKWHWKRGCICASVCLGFWLELLQQLWHKMVELIYAKMVTKW